VNIYHIKSLLKYRIQNESVTLTLFCEFCWLLITFNKEFLRTLSVNLQEFRVKVSRLNCERFIAPSRCIL